MFNNYIFNFLELDNLITYIIMISTILSILISVAYYTLLERKVLAAMQRRRGPNVVGIYGLLQPLADGLKLMAKEGVIPTLAVSGVYLIAPMISLIMSFAG
jgi:NADH-quinone oxidoreductase subunit H